LIRAPAAFAAGAAGVAVLGASGSFPPSWRPARRRCAARQSAVAAKTSATAITWTRGLRIG
jgi:hypothetical protein